LCAFTLLLFKTRKQGAASSSFVGCRRGAQRAKRAVQQ